MILGDSLHVMTSLAEREGLRGKVQCIYIDPPYGIKFNSNFQWSTTSRDVKDGNVEHITREPEQVKAFRDTWRDGIHSYLTYLRDRMTVARDLLNESGSIFIQIGDENVHRVRMLVDDIFGDRNFVAQITFRVKSPLGVSDLARTTAYVAEQWGRRWITIDTSRVALALARTRIMGARYHYYILADSREGQLKEAEMSRTAPLETPTYGNVRQGFVYERVPHITLKAIANNAEIDVVWDKYQEKLEALRRKLNKALNKNLEEWEITREVDVKWSAEIKKIHNQWWEQRIARQQEIDASIAAKAEFEYLYDKPYEDKKKVRVAGPFTVESLSPHHVLAVDENDELIDGLSESGMSYTGERGFVQMILENLKASGVQQAHKDAVLLLDEPGLHLHPTAQQELIIFFESLSNKDQLLYTTHSPF